MSESKLYTIELGGDVGDMGGKAMITEKLIGQAERKMLGNDLYWDFSVYDQNVSGYFIRLKWIGYNDSDWWNKWSKGTEVKEQNGRKFRIDYANCNIYELVGED